MKLVVLYGLIIGVFLSFGSCKSTDDEFQPDDVLPPVPEGYVRMQITVPGLTPVSTYALGTVDETHVSTVDVLVFGSDSKYLCYAAVTEPSKIIGAGSTKTFDVDLRGAGNITDAYVMVVANAAVDTTGFAVSQPTKEAVMQSMTFASSGKWNVAKTNDTDFKPFPMWGMTASPVSLAGASSISSISLIRSVARIDVGLKFPDSPVDGAETAAGLGSTFTLEEIYLYNSLNKGSIAPYSGKYTVDAGTGKITATDASIPASPDPGINDSPVPSYLSSNGTADGFDTNKFSCTGAIYMAEHAAGTDALTNNPYLVIGGRYGSSTADITYYRLDFVSGNYPDQEFLPVLRNHRYRFNITGVAGPGYTSADLAAAARPVNLTYALSATDEALTSYDYNGQYALGVSQDSYTLDKAARTVNTLKVSTTFPGGYTATSDRDWLKFGSDFNAGTSSVSGAANTLSTLTFSVAANSGAQREGTITITSGRLTKVVNVTQSNTDGFTVTNPVQTQFPASGVTNSPLTVTSSYGKWCVRVDSDPNGIVTSFGIGNGGSGGTSGGTGTTGITFSLKTNPVFETVSTARLVFFSPTGEFPEEPKTVSLAARTYTAPTNPTSHGGWAGSYIYFSGGYLTFDDTPASTPSSPTAAEKRQGVLFKWGSLVGLDPYRTRGNTSWTAGSGNINRVYVPSYNSTTPTSSTWTNNTAYAAGYDNWGNIPYVTTGSGSVTNYAHLTLNKSNQSGGYDPANKQGDICRYLSETGKAPGSPDVRWRMPTVAEFAVPSGATDDEDYVPTTTDTWPDVTNTFSGNAAGTWTPVNGRRKKYDHASKTALTYQPYFPAGGWRNPDGELYKVGYEDDPWSSSPYNANAYYLHFRNYTVNTVCTSYRTHGLHVRCVKEL